MDLRQLNSFAAVAGEGTYTAAAARQHISQPALWRQVRELEAELGVTLFERAGRNVRITASGSLLLERAESVLAGAERVTDLAQAIRLGRSGRVRIGCFSPHIVSFLAPVVAEVRQQQPGIIVELIDFGARGGSGPPLQSASLVESLRSGSVDVIMTSRLGDPVRMEGLPAYEVRVVVVPPSNGPLAVGPRQTTVAVEWLRERPLVVSPPGFFSRERLDAACKVAGFDPLIDVESSSPAALFALVDAGVGVAVVANDAAGDRRALVLTLDSRPLRDEVWMYRRSGPGEHAVDLVIEAAQNVRKHPRRGTGQAGPRIRSARR